MQAPHFKPDIGQQLRSNCVTSSKKNLPQGQILAMLAARTITL